MLLWLAFTGIVPVQSADSDARIRVVDFLPANFVRDGSVSYEAEIQKAIDAVPSTGGILIPATAQVSRRLAWAEVKATGPNVRSMEIGDQVLFNPDDRYEVEVRGQEYIILRERDIHAVAAPRLEEGSTGLYL